MELEPYVGEPDVARFIAQIRGEPVDRVPYCEALVDDEHVERILGRYAGNTLAIGGDPAKGAAEASREASQTAEKAAQAAMGASREAAARAEEVSASVRDAAEAAAAAAAIKAEEAMKKAEKALLATIVKKVLSSNELILIITVAILGSVFAAVAISLALGLIGR